MNRWFVSRQGKLTGPFTLPQLQNMVQAGTLRPADLVCWEGGRPTTANQVDGLFAEPSLGKTVPIKPAIGSSVQAVPLPQPAARPAPAEPASGPERPRTPPLQIVAVHRPNLSRYGLAIGIGIFSAVVFFGYLSWFSHQKQEPRDTDIVDHGKRPLTGTGKEKSPTEGKTGFTELSRKPPNEGRPEHPADSPPIEPKVLPVSKPQLFSPEIQGALNKGVAHLEKRILGKDPLFRHAAYEQFGSDAPTGAAALTGLALLEAKVSPNSPSIQQALKRVREGAPRMRLVYALGATLFFLNRLDDVEHLSEPDRGLVRALALRLLAGQTSDGRWTYANPPITLQTEKALLDTLHANTYQPLNNRPSHPTSHSMTQFALLALWGSRRHDIPVRPAILIAAARFHQTQHADGTWDYRPGTGKILCDSNTCAGLIALAMENTLREDRRFQDSRAEDPPANPKSDEQRIAAFGHLSKVIGRTKDDPGANTPDITGTIIKADAWGDYYFLWCLERVAVIYDRNEIGGKNWGSSD